MVHFIVIGAGLTGVTTAYVLSKRGYQVTVIEKKSYDAMRPVHMEGEQVPFNAVDLPGTAGIAKNISRVTKKDVEFSKKRASPSFANYWLSRRFRRASSFPYCAIETAGLAIAARHRVREIAERESIQFDLETRGILQLYHDKSSFDAAIKVSEVLVQDGLDMTPVTAQEIKSIEPALQGNFYGGMFTPSDFTGDIHKFSDGLRVACQRLGVRFIFEAEVCKIDLAKQITVRWRCGNHDLTVFEPTDALVVCAGTASARLAATMGDFVPANPVEWHSITAYLDNVESQAGTAWVGLRDDRAKIETSRLGEGRFRIGGIARRDRTHLGTWPDPIKQLTEWTKQNFPAISRARFVPWSGLMTGMPDMVRRVFVGRNPKVFYNIGHGNFDWTLSCGSAELLAEVADQMYPQHA